MKRFLILLLIFLIPITTFLVLEEVLVHTIPNSYSFKYDYIKKHGKEIEAIAIGHSQLYDGFKPETFKVRAFNLCNSAQPYKEDYYILKELIQYMPSLKVVTLPIGYINVTSTQEDGFSERSTFYYEYMHINYDQQIPIRYRYECFNPKRAFEKITAYYLHHIDIIGCDSLGRRSTHYLKNRTNKLGTGMVLTSYTIKNTNKMYIQGDNYLEQIGKMLNINHIKMVLVSPPHYWKDFEETNVRQKQFLQQYIEKLSNKIDFQYINLENDDRFEDEDFFDEAHLTEYGAEKFTKILNDSIYILRE